MLRTRSPLSPGQALVLARLACIRRAASVRPEPGSNSPSRSRPPPEGAGLRSVESRRPGATTPFRQLATVRLRRASPWNWFCLGLRPVAAVPKRGRSGAECPHWLCHSLFRFQGAAARPFPARGRSEQTLTAVGAQMAPDPSGVRVKLAGRSVGGEPPPSGLIILWIGMCSVKRKRGRIGSRSGKLSRLARPAPSAYSRRPMGSSGEKRKGRNHQHLPKVGTAPERAYAAEARAGGRRRELRDPRGPGDGLGPDPGLGAGGGHRDRRHRRRGVARLPLTGPAPGPARCLSPGGGPSPSAASPPAAAGRRARPRPGSPSGRRPAPRRPTRPPA